MTFLDKYLFGDDRPTWLIWVVYITVVIGLIYLAYWIYKPLAICCKHKCRGQQDLMKKYGQGSGASYAVVTGGSDGIGLELCHQFARQGFNICMISRNKAKMEEKVNQLKDKFTSIDVIAIECDFSNLSKI